MEYLIGPLEDRNISSIEPIKSPFQLKKEIPNHSANLVSKTRQEISNILHGRDTRRLVMIVGPCSIHDPKPAIEYAQKLLQLKSQLEDDLVIVMRTYFEKPRTTVGWTGLAYEPLSDESKDGITGVATARQLLADINSLGLPCAVEILDPITPQYYGDFFSWGSVGARTPASSPHRKIVSGLSMPVGFKNSAEGSIKVAAEAMITASEKHIFFGINDYGLAAVVRTLGNRDTHVVLRGSDKGTNYDAASVNKALEFIDGINLLEESSRPIMIDSSHGNSTKNYKRQSVVVSNVLEQIQSGQRRIMGIMIESNLYEGQQGFTAGQDLIYGVSITDGCIGWEETERLVLNSARMMQPKKYVMA